MTIINGDCRSVMADMSDCSIDSVVCDPPYELSSDGKTSPARVAVEMVLPKKPKIVPVGSGECGLEFLAAEIARLCGVRGIPQPSSPMPICAVTFDNDSTCRDHDIEHRDPSSGFRIPHSHPGDDAKTQGAKYLGRFSFECANRESMVNAFNRSGAAFLSGAIGVGFAISPPSYPRALGSCPSVIISHKSVRLIDDATSHLVGTHTRTEHENVARLAMRGGTVEPLSARGALILLSLALSSGSQLIRTTTTAGCLPSMPESDCVRYVVQTANGAIAFDLFSHSVSVSSSGFMGKAWDGSKIAYNVDMWQQVLRVMKPGAHLLAFGGTRTYHRMACAIEDAGFEIRDCLQWVYGSGFPKSHNVSKAIDRAAGAERETIGSYTIGGNAGMSCKDKGGTYGVGVGTAPPVDVAITAPATPEAQQWDGWGTSLKPAHEPIVLARKPFKGTVAANVLEHGTGAINVDACRVEADQSEFYSSTGKPRSGMGHAKGYGMGEGYGGDAANPPHVAGRWPPNVLLDADAAVMMDEQSGHLHGAGFAQGPQDKWSSDDTHIYGHGMQSGAKAARHGDTGGASRFFPRFKYCAKASRKERERGLGGVETIVVECATWENGESPVRLRVDTGQSPPRVIGVYGADNSDVTGWSTFLFGRRPMVPSHQATVSTTRTNESLTTGSKILNWLTTSPTNAFTVDVNCETDNGGSHAESAGECSTSIAIIAESAVCLPGAGPVVSGTRLRIKRSDGNERANIHSTVKPIDLMRWLCRLVTPPNGLVLDPFAGSGTTGIACAQEGFRFVGIEQNAEYVAIADKRIAATNILATIESATQMTLPA